ncbi:hypothetical protein T492DRAFT_1126118 [Pavlovales sp. CCMP2436]|nr:hypothetical protein T492DRAFT_1126118 [Pavlovales sp. CCMP2436]
MLRFVALLALASGMPISSLVLTRGLTPAGVGGAELAAFGTRVIGRPLTRVGTRAIGRPGCPRPLIAMLAEKRPHGRLLAHAPLTMRAAMPPALPCARPPIAMLAEKHEGDASGTPLRSPTEFWTSFILSKIEPELDDEFQLKELLLKNSTEFKFACFQSRTEPVLATRLHVDELIERIELHGGSPAVRVHNFVSTLMCMCVKPKEKSYTSSKSSWPKTTSIFSEFPSKRCPNILGERFTGRGAQITTWQTKKIRAQLNPKLEDTLGRNKIMMSADAVLDRQKK